MVYLNDTTLNSEVGVRILTERKLKHREGRLSRAVSWKAGSVPRDSGPRTISHTLYLCECWLLLLGTKVQQQFRFLLPCSVLLPPGEGNGTPLQYSCLENPMDGGAWWAAVHGVTKRQTQLSDFTFTCHFHALQKEMAIHSSVLAWRIPGRGEPGGLPSMGSQSRTRLKRLSSSILLLKGNALLEAWLNQWGEGREKFWDEMMLKWGQEPTPLRLRTDRLFHGLPRWCWWWRIRLSMQETEETRVWSLDQEDALEKQMATCSSILGENSMDRGAWQATVHGLEKIRTQLSTCACRLFHSKGK